VRQWRDRLAKLQAPAFALSRSFNCTSSANIDGVSGACFASSYCPRRAAPMRVSSARSMAGPRTVRFPTKQRIEAQRCKGGQKRSSAQAQGAVEPRLPVCLMRRASGGQPILLQPLVMISVETGLMAPIRGRGAGRPGHGDQGRQSQKQAYGRKGQRCCFKRHCHFSRRYAQPHRSQDVSNHAADRQIVPVLPFARGLSLSEPCFSAPATKAGPAEFAGTQLLAGQHLPKRRISSS
jgi:hypothetical protein